MEGEEIVESKWAGRVINFPCDRRRALAMLNSIRELVEASFAFEDETHRYEE